MAEVRNTFIGSRMNKDLEQRLVPNSEYRDAYNVMISRSEGEDVGSLENVLGNIKITDFGITDCEVEAIGVYFDVITNRVYVMLTNYIDTSESKLDNQSVGGLHAIAYTDLNKNVSDILVQGEFLNFSKTHPIYGINLVDNFLFWTDNRNQPRKINIKNAIDNPATSPNPYYINEAQISVAKVFPNKPISLQVRDIVGLSGICEEGTQDYTTTPVGEVYATVAMADIGGSFGWVETNGFGMTVRIVANLAGEITSIEIVDRGYGYGEYFNERIYICKSDGTFDVDNGSYFQTIDGTSCCSFRWNPAMKDVTSELLPDNVTPNPFYDVNYKGDKQFLENKFVRFGYRFKFDDNEYSLISPYTPEAFIPKQDGYFIGDDEQKTFKSTEVEFMENKVTQIELQFRAPDRLKWRDAIKKYNISEVEIIMKESVQSSLTSVYTIKSNELTNHPSALIQYKYRGNKATKTLPQKDLLRVYDQVPVRALCQEFADGAVVYGNFLDKHTPPEGIDFEIDANIKENRVANDNYPASSPSNTVVVTAPLNEGLRKTAPNHTLKQNRNYKVGIVLSDKFGRQSSVLNTQPLPYTLKGITQTNTQNTIYHPFKEGLNSGPATGVDANATNTFNWWGIGLGPDVDATDQNLWGPPTSPGGNNFNPESTWPGDVLRLQLNETINSARDATSGSPGLYSEGGQLLAVNILNTVGNNWFDGDYTINIINGVVSPIVPGVLMSYGNNITAAEEYCYGRLTIVTDSSTAPGEGNITQAIVTPSNTNKLEGVYNVNDIITLWSGGAPGFGDESTFEVTLVTEANPLGWYTYKFVVQQQEQEYYNAYIPGILNGYIDGGYFPENQIYSLDNTLTPEENYYKGFLNVATPDEPVIHFALHGDNINKVPRDLSLLGPTDTIFRTGRPSVQDDPSYYQFRNTDGELFTIDPYEPEAEALLKDRDRKRGIDSGSVITNSSIKFWPRVTNNAFVGNTDQPGSSENALSGALLPVKKCAFSNTQYYTPIEPSEVTTIGTGQELGLWNPSTFYPYNTAKVFYNYQQNPLIAKADVIVKEPRNICSLGAIGPYWSDGVFNMGIMSVFYIDTNEKEDSYIAGSKNVPYQNVRLQDNCALPGPPAFGGTFQDINIHGWLVNINGVSPGPVGSDTTYTEGDAGHLVLESIDAGAPTSPIPNTRTLTISNKGFTEGVSGLELIPDNRYTYGDPAQNVAANRLNFRCKVGSGNNSAITYNQVYKRFSAGSMEPVLSILEIEPIRSLLPIYWETSTSGFIKDINDQYQEDNETKFEVNYFNSLWLKKCPKYEAILNLHTPNMSGIPNPNSNSYPPNPPVKEDGECGWFAPELVDYYMGKLVGVWPGIAPDLGYDSCPALSDLQEGVPKIIEINTDLLTSMSCGIGFCDVHISYPDFMFPFTPGSCGGTVPPSADVEAFPGSCGEALGESQGGWYIEEARVRGGFNNAGMSLGVKAYIIDDNPKGQYRTQSIIHSGIINTRSGYNESNVFSISSPIVKDMDPLHGSLQRFYTEDTNLFTFQESKVNRVLINKNVLYSGDQGSQDTSAIKFLGQTYAYAGEYGISQDPGSFSLFGYRKYFIDRDRSVACRLSGDGITEISGYGMRDWFRDQLSAMTIDWKACKSPASTVTSTDAPTYSITVNTAYDCSYIGSLLEVGGVIDPQARVSNMVIDTIANTTVITFTTATLPIPGNEIKLVLYKRDSIVSGWDIHNSNYTICIERPKEGDDKISSNDDNYNYYTTCFDEQVQGWISFYDFRPIKLDSLKNYFYSLKEGKLWRHYDDGGGNNYGKFYGATVPATTFINFIFNPNPNITKNFKTISYEGSNGWETFGGTDLQEVYRTDPQNFVPPFTYGTDYLDTYSTVNSLDEGVYINPTSGYPENSGFVLKENRYVADLLSKNGSSDLRPGQVLYGESVGYPLITPFGMMTGVKGYVLNVTFIVDDTTDVGGRKELFSTASNFVVSST